MHPPDERSTAHTSSDVVRAHAERLHERGAILKDTRVYLSGPMDFVASRAEEKAQGWRNRVGKFLRHRGARVYDPWNKPPLAGLGRYGKEDEFTAQRRERWTYDPSDDGARARAALCCDFWPTTHIDLRMTDSADFLVAYCPTNVYSVGTVHEIAMARQQHKPVLLVTPPVEMAALDALDDHLKASGDDRGSKLLEALRQEVPLRPNAQGIPSLWYMAILDADYFFDGFGFAQFAKDYGWQPGPLDEREQAHPPQRPLLPYLDGLDAKLPRRFDVGRNAFVENDDWLVFDVDET